MTIASFWIAWSAEEGSSSNEIILAIAKSAYIFGFPVHIVFPSQLNSELFFIGIFFNALFYSLVIEVLIRYIKRRNNRKPFF